MGFEHGNTFKDLEAKFDATIGADTGVVNPAAASSGLSQDMAALNLVNPAAASSGLSQDMAALNLGVPQTSAALHYCPVPGCISAAGGRRPGWETDGQDLRNHVDAHLLGQIPGLPAGELDEQSENGRVQGLWTYGELTLQQWDAPRLSGG